MNLYQSSKKADDPKDTISTVLLEGTVCQAVTVCHSNEQIIWIYFTAVNSKSTIAEKTKKSTTPCCKFWWKYQQKDLQHHPTIQETWENILAIKVTHKELIVSTKQHCSKHSTVGVWKNKRQQPLGEWKVTSTMKAKTCYSCYKHN